MVFRKSCWGESLIPTGTIHKSAHASYTVNLSSFTLAAATRPRCTYTASHEQCFPLVHRITGCLRQNVLDKRTLHNMQLQRCMSLVWRHSVTKHTTCRTASHNGEKNWELHRPRQRTPSQEIKMLHEPQQSEPQVLKNVPSKHMS